MTAFLRQRTRRWAENRSRLRKSGIELLLFLVIFTCVVLLSFGL